VTVFRFAPFRALLLGLLLLVLSFKGQQELSVDTSFSLVVELPSWVVAFKSAAEVLGVAFLFGYLLVSVTGRLKPAPYEVIGYVLVLAYYFIRSATLQSGSVTDLVALVIVVIFTFAVGSDLTKSGRLKQNECSQTCQVRALGIFFSGYVLAGSILFGTGYGYPQIGFRFVGVTYHPNAHGAYSALSAGYFLAAATAQRLSGKNYTYNGVLFVLSCLLVIISGSRTAFLMATLAILLLSPLFAIVVAGFASTVLFSFHMGVVDFGETGPISGAIQRAATATTGNRLEVWDILISDFLADPIFGVGSSSGVSGSAILTSLAGGGLLAFLVFVSAFTSAFKKSIRNVFDFRRTGVVTTSIYASVLFIEICIQGAFEGALFDRFSPIPLLTILLLYQIGQKAQN